MSRAAGMNSYDKDSARRRIDGYYNRILNLGQFNQILSGVEVIRWDCRIMMSKKFAYLTARRYQELELFKGVAKADEYYIDLVDNAGRSDFNDLTKMLETVEAGDTLIHPSTTIVNYLMG